MAVKLRLMRTGKKKQPSYRVVAADSRSPRDGRFIELIGRYDPRQEPSVVEIDNDKAVSWLEKGAQPTDPVRKLLQISGAWSAFTGEAPLAAAPVGAPEAPPAAKAVEGHQQEIHVVGEEAEDEPPAPTHEEAAAAAVAAESAEGDAVESAVAEAAEAVADATEEVAEEASKVKEPEDSDEEAS